MKVARSSSDSALRRRSIRAQIASFSAASLDATNPRASCQHISKSSSSPASESVFMNSPHLWVEPIKTLQPELAAAFHFLRGVSRRTVSYTHLRAHETVLDLVC